MKIICGLGNPGRQYELTHHNMGFLTIDELSERLGVKVNKLKFKSLYGETFVNGEKVILVKPQTFMNSSGEALRPLAEYYKAGPQDILLIYDDIDIPCGTLRIRAKGSSGSHNGMKSVIYQLGYDDFARIRIGIGNNGIIPLDKFVLMGISDDEAKLLKPAVENAASAALLWITDGIAKAMNEYNSKKSEQ